MAREGASWLWPPDAGPPDGFTVSRCCCWRCAPSGVPARAHGRTEADVVRDGGSRNCWRRVVVAAVLTVVSACALLDAVEAYGKRSCSAAVAVAGTPRAEALRLCVGCGGDWEAQLPMKGGCCAFCVGRRVFDTLQVFRGSTYE